MRMTSRLIAVLVSGSTLLVGPLAPLAVAQSPAQPAPPTSAAPPPPPSVPGLLPETMKPADQPQPQLDAYDVGATVANVIAIPGKTALCVVGGAVSVAILAITFGSGYKAAAQVAGEGCGGKWIITGEDLRPGKPTSRAFEWERM